MQQEKTTKLRIVEESLRLFAKNGYSATSMADIAEAVGIRKPSLYSHFDSKESIHLALVDYIKGQYQQGSVVFEKIDNKTYPESFEELINDVMAHIRFSFENENSIYIRKLLIREQYSFEPVRDQLQLHGYDGIVEYNTKVFRNFIDNKLIRDDLDPEIIGTQFSAIVSYEIYHIDRYPDKIDEILKKLERMLVEFLNYLKI